MLMSRVITTVVVSTILASLSFTVNFVMAQSETVESAPLNNTILLPGLNRSERNQTRYNFTAAEYFYPVKPGVDRSHLPERLTFEIDREIDLETLKERLAEQPWKTVFHCKGQALLFELFSDTSLVDGVINPSSIERYSFANNQGEINQTLYAPELKTEFWGGDLERSYIIQSLDDLGQGRFKLAYNRPLNKIYSEELVVVRIKETSELLIQIRAEFQRNGAAKICPDKSTPDALLVPMPNDLFS